MAHFPKPFFKRSRNSWYVEINRKQIKLGLDRDEAFRLSHQLMQQPSEVVTAPRESLVNIIDAFLDWHNATGHLTHTNSIGTDFSGLSTRTRT